MPNFNYKAKDKSGNTITGVVDASDEHIAAGMVREMGYTPLDIRLMHSNVPQEISNEAGSFFVRHFVYPIWTGVSINALAFFFRQMATLLHSGMSLSQSLKSAGSRTGGRLGRIVLEMCDHVQNGGRFSEAMARHPRVFGTLSISLIRAGEASGMLEQMVDRIASYLEYEISIRRMISKTMLYPILIFVFIVLTLFVVSHIELLTGKKSSVSPALVSAWQFACLIIYSLPAIIVALRLTFQFETPRIIWDSIKIVPPIIGYTAHKIAMSRFCRAFSVLYSSGMPIAEAVSVAADACANLALGRRIKCAVPGVIAGTGITEALTKTGAMSPMVLDMLSTGQQTGSFDLVLEKVSDYMDAEADSTIHKLGIVMFVVSILVAAVVVLFIMINFYGGYMNQMMGSGG